MLTCKLWHPGLIVAVGLLSGCEQVQSMTTGKSCTDPSMNAAERQICHDNTTFNNTVAGGAAVGALGGAALGALTCGLSGHSPLACAAIGGVAGGVAGGVGGYLVAKKQEANTNHERAIDAITADVEHHNQILQSDVSSAEEMVSDSQQQLTTIQAQTRSGQLNADQADARRARIADDAKNLDGLVTQMQKDETKLTQAAQQSGQTSPQFDAQITSMREQIAALQQQRNALNAALSTTPSNNAVSS